MNRIFLVLLLFGFRIAAAQQNTTSSPVRTSSVKSDKHPSAGTKWDEKENFLNGFAVVLQNNKFSFLDKNENLICPLQFDGVRNFSSKLAAVSKDSKWGFINEAGKMVIPYQYEIVYDFTDSITPAFKNKTWYLIDITGQIIKTLDVLTCDRFHNGNAKVSGHGKAGVMDKTGTIIYSETPAVKHVVSRFHSQNTLSNQCPENIDFEDGDFTGWNCFKGGVDSLGTTNVITVTASAPAPDRHKIYSVSTPSAIDPYGQFALNPPDGSNFAIKLGNTRIGAEAERIQYKIRVPTNDSNFSIRYDYAVVFQDPGHTAWTQPRFTAKLFDSSANAYIDCASFEYIATSSLPGFAVSPIDTSVIYKPWASAFISLRGYAGKTMYLEFTTADCVRRGHWGYAYVDVENVCAHAIDMNLNCTTGTTDLSGPPGFQTYNWWNADYSTLIASGQNITVNPSLPENSTIWLEIIPFSDFGCRDTLPVKPGESVAAVDQPADISACEGLAVPGVIFGGTAVTTFAWTNDNLSIGLPASGQGNIPSFPAVNSSGLPIIAHITVTPGGTSCPGTPKLFSVTISPIPTVPLPDDQVVCNRSQTNPVLFSSFTNSESGYTWTNSQPSIGLPSQGSGDIPAFTALNEGTVPVIATITIIASSNSCTSAPAIFHITVNPSPALSAPAAQIICNGSLSHAAVFSGNMTNTTFTWSNSQPSIGLSADGNGDLPAFLAINNTNAALVANIQVIASAGGCQSIPANFLIQVNPTPVFTQPTDQSICSGNSIAPINFLGAVTGTTYVWTNTDQSIGLPANGIGNIAAFTATNTTGVSLAATITVTATANGCSGGVTNFTITVNPSPVLSLPANRALCNGIVSQAVVMTAQNTTTVVSWTNSNPSIGLALEGAGNIPSFVAINNGAEPVTSTVTIAATSNNCTSMPGTFTITVNPGPLVHSENNLSVCRGTAVQLNATGGSNYSWSPSVGLSCTTCANPVATPVDSVRYFVEGTSTYGCVGRDSILLVVRSPFTMRLPPDDTVCAGKSGILKAMNADTYSWSPATGLNRTDIAAPTATPVATTRYRVVGYDAYHCFTDTGYITITIAQLPTVKIGENITVTNGSPVTLHPVISNGPIAKYTWTPSEGLSCNDCLAPTVMVKGNTTYSLTVQNEFGCAAADNIVVNAFCMKAEVFVPTAFTPDGDGLNDVLMIRGSGITVKSYSVFNRWGEMVFERKNFLPNDPKNGWDGKIRGMAATAGVYVYTAEVVCDNGTVYMYKGNTTILK